MTTIPTLNLVVQQGNSVIQAKSALHPALDSNQISSAYQPIKEEIVRTTVSELEEKHKVLADKKESQNRDRDKKKNKKKQDEEIVLNREKDIGEILNTKV